MVAAAQAANVADRAVICDGRVLLRDIGWATYERLLKELEDKVVPHLYYDGGELEIVQPGFAHERAKGALTRVIDVVSDEWSIDIASLGSTTHKRPDLQKGFEPDAAYFIEQAERMRGKDELDLMLDPPADLVIEIDITDSSLARLPIYAAIGVPEVWRYARGRVEMRVLQGGSYLGVPESRALPGLTDDTVTAFVAQAHEVASTAWTRSVREWARALGTREREANGTGS